MKDILFLIDTRDTKKVKEWLNDNIGQTIKDFVMLDSRSIQVIFETKNEEVKV